MKPLHNLVQLPAGKTLADILPVFKHIENEVHIVTQNPACAGCRKPFTAVRKRRKSFRLYPVALCQTVPVGIEQALCGSCWRQYQAGGDRKEALLAAIDAFNACEEVRPQ